MEKDFRTGYKKSIDADRINLTRRRKAILRECGLSELLNSAEIAVELKKQMKVNAALSRTIEAKDKEIAVKNLEIEARDIKITELEKRLSAIPFDSATQIKKTSGNSSVPPSKNPIGIPHTQSQRKKSGLRSGGQKGHKGSTLIMSDDVDEVIKWYPAAVCPECGRQLDMQYATAGKASGLIHIFF